MEIFPHYFSCPNKPSLLVFAFKETHYTGWTESTEAREAVTNVKGINNILKVENDQRGWRTFFVSNIQTSLRQPCAMHVDLFGPALDDGQKRQSLLSSSSVCVVYLYLAWSLFVNVRTGVSLLEVQYFPVNGTLALTADSLPSSEAVTSTVIVFAMAYSQRVLWPHKDNASHQSVQCQVQCEQLVFLPISWTEISPSFKVKHKQKKKKKWLGIC